MTSSDQRLPIDAEGAVRALQVGIWSLSVAAPLIGLLASVVALPTIVAGGIPAGVGIGAALIGYHLGQKHK